MILFSTRLPMARISETLRWPLWSRWQCTSMSKHEATVGTTNAPLMFFPAIRGSVHILVTASRPELACSEHNPGSPNFAGGRYTTSRSILDNEEGRRLSSQPFELKLPVALGFL